MDGCCHRDWRSRRAQLWGRDRCFSPLSVDDAADVAADAVGPNGRDSGGGAAGVYRAASDHRAPPGAVTAIADTAVVATVTAITNIVDITGTANVEIADLTDITDITDAADITDIETTTDVADITATTDSAAATHTKDVAAETWRRRHSMTAVYTKTSCIKVAA